MKEQIQGYHTLSIANAEKIGFIGDSYTESHFSVEGKAYICKLSLFSDYNYENFAKSGDTYRGNLDRMRKKLPIYHDKLSWQDYKPKYAVMISYTNDLKYMDEAQYLNDLRAVVETVRSLGALPIIATEYHSNFGPGIQIGLKEVAREYGCEFVDILDEVAKTRGKDYTPFWGGTHPGTRTNHLMADPLEEYLDQLPRPRQSLKLFRLREDFNELSELIFHTNEERAKLFKEINVGHSALTNSKEVDAVTAASHDPITSEYLMLQNGEGVNFENIALISAILPSTSLGLEEVGIDLGDFEGDVYIKDIVKEPYPTPTFYQRFDLEGKVHVAVGDEYKSDNPHFKDYIFTVKEVDGQSILALPYPRIATNIPGKLTKVSGQGEDEIAYPYTAIGFSNDYPEGKAQIGHYIKLTKKDGKYMVPKSLLEKAVDYDKIHFLAVKQGQFELSKVEVLWKGVENKVYTHKPFSKLSAKGEILLPMQTVQNEEALATWQGVTDQEVFVPEDECLPGGLAGCTLLTADGSLSKVVSYTVQEEARPVLISAVARYFPEIYDLAQAKEQCAITEMSYDYGTLCLDMIYNGRVYTQKRRVGMHWKDVKFETILPAHTSEVMLRLYTEEKPLQFVSLSMQAL